MAMADSPSPLAELPIVPQESSPVGSLTPAEPLPASEPLWQGQSTWVAFLPRDPQWAIVCWGIHPEDRARALAAGAQELALRLTDVTDGLLRDSRPHLFQEVTVAESANEWHLPVPLGDRDYQVELGYRTPGGGWYALAISPVSRMPADLEIPVHPFTPFALEDAQETVMGSVPLPAAGLHESLYQQSSSGRWRAQQGSDAFHEQHGRSHSVAGDHLSGVGLWASGREASGAGIAPRQRSFWLVADAELIVYGATDPAATLTVGDQAVPLDTDGTFRWHTTFPDGAVNYPIRARAADGEQKRSITLDFRRTTPHAHVNRRENAVQEWF